MYGWQGGQTDKGTSDSQTPQALLLAQGGSLGPLPSRKGKGKGTENFPFGSIVQRPRSR